MVTAKDPENKNCLVIDSYAADIVRKNIFMEKIDGFSLGAIAEKTECTSCAVAKRI